MSKTKATFTSPVFWAGLLPAAITWVVAAVSAAAYV